MNKSVVPEGILMVIDTPPYGSWQGREALDMALSLAAFDQPVALLFRGEGVNWVRPDQDGEPVHQKTVSRNLGAAHLFGVEAFYADRGALERFGLQNTDPEVIPVTADAGFYAGFQEVVQL